MRDAPRRWRRRGPGTPPGSLGGAHPRIDRRSRADQARYDRSVSRATAFVDEVANELDTWPGVRIERRADGAAVVMYERLELGILDRDRGVVELGVSHPERDDLIEHGDAEADPSRPYSDVVRHDLRGPSDVTAVLELFDRRYRDLR